MIELFQIIISICILALGIPIGNFLAKVTREELFFGQRWFRLIIILCLIGGSICLIIHNDILMFSLFFIAIVASRSIKIKK
jgi:hypothetical protein